MLSYRTNPRDRRLKRQAVEYSVIKNVLGRQIQYTHTHFCYLVLKKKGGGKGQDTVIRPAPIHLNFNERHHCVHIVMKEANLVHLELGTRFCTGHRQVPRILSESSFKVLFPHDYPQVFLF